eukprot:SAG11_NODE_35363_length_267_cov_0.547619_1_plen_27_part_10
MHRPESLSKTRVAQGVEPRTTESAHLL